MFFFPNIYGSLSVFTFKFWWAQSDFSAEEYVILKHELHITYVSIGGNPGIIDKRYTSKKYQNSNFRLYKKVPNVIAFYVQILLCATHVFQGQILWLRNQAKSIQIWMKNWKTTRFVSKNK